MGFEFVSKFPDVFNIKCLCFSCGCQDIPDPFKNWLCEGYCCCLFNNCGLNELLITQILCLGPCTIPESFFATTTTFPVRWFWTELHWFMWTLFNFHYWWCIGQDMLVVNCLCQVFDFFFNCLITYELLINGWFVNETYVWRNADAKTFPIFKRSRSLRRAASACTSHAVSRTCSTTCSSAVSSSTAWAHLKKARRCSAEPHRRSILW